MRVGGGVTGGAAGRGSAAALGRQCLLPLLQLLFGDVVLGQRGDLRVLGGAADWAGLAPCRSLASRPARLAFELALHRAVFFLGAVQCSLCGHILCLTRGGVLVGLVGVRRFCKSCLQSAESPSASSMRWSVLSRSASAWLSAARSASFLAIFSFTFAVRFSRSGLNEVGLVLHIGGALLLGHQPGQLAAAGGAFLGNFQAGVTAGDLLVQLVHNAGLSFVGVVGLQRASCPARRQPLRQTGRARPAFRPGRRRSPRRRRHRSACRRASKVHRPDACISSSALRLDGGLTQALVVGGVKNAAQDGGAVRGRRVEQPGKVVLSHIDTWANCLASMPSSLTTASVAADAPLTGSSGSRISSALAGTLTMPVPRLAARCSSASGARCSCARGG